jgi:GT2 family glycosyltransferase
MKPSLDILIPTFERPAALAVTLTSLAAQTRRDFRVVISDQSAVGDAASEKEVQAAQRVLELHGCPVEIVKHLPPRGMAEQRQFLLDQAQAPYALFLDDDLIVEPYVIELMLGAIAREKVGFVGSAVIGLSFLQDVRPHEQAVELWEGPVQPETVTPGSAAWQRYRLHNAANLYHVQEALGATPEAPILYRVAWVGGCVLYDVEKLRKSGGFLFWKELPPEHCGEDVLAQLRVMEQFGGCGIMPSGVYHQELPTTIENRRVNAPEVLSAFKSHQNVADN